MALPETGEVMYTCVRGHAYVCYRSCICVLEVSFCVLEVSFIRVLEVPFCMLEVMYTCVRGHVYVY